MLTVILLLLAGTAAAEPSIIPWPVKIGSTAGSFAIDESSTICASNAAERAVAEQLHAVVKINQGLDLKDRSCERAGITLELSSAAAVSDREGYTLDVTAQGVRVAARDAAGLYYGAMTLSQLLSSGDTHGAPVRLSGMHIEDFPRFKWRGLMLDSARHFFAVSDVKMLLDQMGQHKLNVLHLHLTDDQGWRLEIKRYPELTRIGAWRTPPSSGAVPETNVYGGFYTQEDIREIVGYAAARHISIVPEIDLPGHAQAVIAAHPRLSVLGDRPAVGNQWGVNTYLYNTDEYSLAFVKNVLDEVMRLFPGKYIHLGGDEAIKDQWKAAPAVQAQMQALGLANEDQLQNWFMQQIGAYLAEHGRIMVGWDEILDGPVPSNATIMSWRGTQGAITAARLGHDVVMSPAPTLYFDNLQSARDDEPAGRLGIVPLSAVYNFDAMPAALSSDERRHVLGAQANLWSEYLLSSWYLQHATFPRIDALSEALWTAPSRMNWSGFLARLPRQLQRYRRQDIAFADAAFAVDFQLVEGRNAPLQAGAGTVTLANQTGFGQIRCTVDGSVPNAKSTLCDSPLPLKLGSVIKATAFSEEGLPLAFERTYRFNAQTLLTHQSNQLQACPGNALGLRLPLTPDSPAVAPVFNVNLLNSCYIQPKARLSDVSTLKIDVARLPRNFGLANRKNQLKSYAAQTPFGELVIYRDRCESGPEVARIALADPAASANRQSFQLPMAPVNGEHDLCFIFTAPTSGPLYAIDTVTLLPRGQRPN